LLLLLKRLSYFKGGGINLGSSTLRRTYKEGTQKSGLVRSPRKAKELKGDHAPITSSGAGATGE